MHTYTRVSDQNYVDEEKDSFDQLEDRRASIKTVRNHVGWTWILQTVLFLTSSIFFLSGLRLHQRPLDQCNDADFLPMWSPVLDAVKNTGHLHRFDGSFATPNEYKGLPSPLIDGAWNRVLMAEGTHRCSYFLRGLRY